MRWYFSGFVRRESEGRGGKGSGTHHPGNSCGVKISWTEIGFNERKAGIPVVG